MNDNIGTFYKNQYVWDIGYTDFEKAKEISRADYEKYNGKNFPTLIQRAFQCGAEGDYKGMVAYGEEGIKLVDEGIHFPDRGDFYKENKAYLEELLYYLVKGYLFLGEIEKTEALIKKFEKRVYLALSKGLLNYKKGNYDKAIRYFTRGNPEQRHKYYMTAKSYERKGEYENAIKYYLLQYKLGKGIDDMNEQMRKYYSLYLSTKKLSVLYEKIGDIHNHELLKKKNQEIDEQIKKGIPFKGGVYMDTNILRFFINQDYDY